MSQPLHQHHYHYLYTYDKNTPLRLTDTQIVQDQNSGVSIFHHHIYTILYLPCSKNSTTQGNIYQLTQDEHQAVEVLSGLDNVEFQIEKKCPTKPTPPVISKIFGKTTQLISANELISRQKRVLAQRISNQAVQSIKNRLVEMDKIIEKHKTLTIGIEVVKDGQRGKIVGKVRRQGRRLRWRVEWEDGSRESYYGQHLKSMMKSFSEQ